MNLRMSAEKRDEVLGIELAGELTLSESPAFRSWVEENVVDVPARVEVDCHDVQYIDSTGLGALIFLRKTVLDQGGEMKLVRVSGWLRKFLQVTGLEETFVASPEAQS